MRAQRIRASAKPSRVDPGQIELIGVSFGAPFVAAAGALDQRFLARAAWSL
jgi:cephalosporin-C deacetylase-like acetyl esterase